MHLQHVALGRHSHHVHQDADLLGILWAAGMLDARARIAPCVLDRQSLNGKSSRHVEPVLGAVLIALHVSLGRDLDRPWFPFACRAFSGTVGHTVGIAVSYQNMAATGVQLCQPFTASRTVLWTAVGY